MATLGDAWVGIHPGGFADFAAAAKAGIQAALAGVKPVVPVGADTKPAVASITALKAQIDALAKTAARFVVDTDTTAAQRKMAVLVGQLNTLAKSVSKIPVDVEVDSTQLLAAQARFLALASAMDEVSKSAAGTETATGAATVGLTALGAIVGTAGRGWGVLNTQIPLFGNVLRGILPDILNQVSVWHLAADAVVEIGAVLIPAGLALGAFAIAGSDAANEIVRRMTDVHTVMDATGQSVPPMTDAMEQLHDAVRPEVYQLFGDALTIMNSKAGEFTTIAKGTATVVDQLAARFTYAVTNGNGFSVFMANAVSDVRQLGDVIGNIGGIFGNLFKAVPGYAQVLLSLADGFTAVLETATRVAEPVIAAGLAIHGFLLYAGLAVTGILAFTGAMAKLIAAFVTFSASQVATGYAVLKSFVTTVASGITAVIGYAGALIGLAGSEGVAAAATVALADAQTVLDAVSPWVWVAAGIAALGGLVYWLDTSKDAAQQFNDTIQKTVDNAQLSQLVTTIQQSQAATAAQLAAANKNLNQTLTEQAPAVTGAASRFESNYSPALDHASESVSQLTAGQQQLASQYQLVNSRLDQLAQRYGSQTAALGALNAAGITSSQITDANNQHWAEALIQVNATTQAYAAMGTQSGALGNDLDILGRTETDQYAALQKLTQQMATFISDVTAGQGAFDTYAQGLDNLTSQSGTLTFSLGKLKVSYADSQAAIDSLTPAGIALNQAFTDQVTNTSKLIESWTSAGISGSQFKDSVAAAITPLEKYAAGSQEATAQLVALAEMAGYQGPVSLQALNKYLGISTGQLNDTAAATQLVKDTTNQATVQEALLTGAMQAQGNYIASTLIGDINQAILKYNGVQQAAQAYGNQLAQFGPQSSQAKSALDVLNNSIIKSGQAAGDSQGQIAAMIAEVDKIPLKAALQIVMTGEGSYTIKDLGGGRSVVTSGPNAGQINTIGGHTAAGGFIGHGTGPTADDVPIWASRGEYVVKASSVAKYGKGMLDQVNAGHFADGGLVTAGNQSVLSGQYAISTYNAFTAQMTSALVSAMRTGLSAAAAAAQAAALPSGPAPPTAGNVVAWITQAMHDTLAPASWLGPLETLVSKESGGNPYAVDPISVYGEHASGLFQTLPSTYVQFATVPGGVFNPVSDAVAGIRYIMARYGSPFNIPGLLSGNYVGYHGGGLVGAGLHARWYDNGGVLPPGATLALNTTGQPETVVSGGAQPMTAVQGAQIIGLLQTLIKATAQQGQQFGNVLNGTLRMGYYGR